MLTLNFTPFPTLTTGRLLLRKIVAEDVHEIFFLRSDNEVLKYIEKEKAKSLEDAHQWIEMITTEQDKNNVITWGICMKDEPKLIGTICFWRILKDHHRAEIGYALHTAFHQKGIMNEAIEVAIKFGFATMKLHTIEARVNPLNMPSIKLLEKNNFVKEGYFKEDYYFNGKFKDTGVYSLLEPRLK